MLRADVGVSAAAPRLGPLAGAETVVEHLRQHSGEFAPFSRYVSVNGSVGLLVQPPSAPPAIVSFTVVGGRITAIDIIGRQKIGGLERR